MCRFWKKQKHSGKEEDADRTPISKNFMPRRLKFADNIFLAELAGDPGAAKVRDWRHKLQRAFLSKAVPKDDVSSAKMRVLNS